jgi:hypothetical protein
MIKLYGTRFFESVQEQLAPGVSISEEGQALSYVKVNGTTYVAPSSALDSSFAGVSIARNSPPATVPVVEEHNVTGGQVTLVKTPKSGQLLVKINGTAATPVVGAPAQGHYSLTNNVLTFNAADEGLPVFVQYVYVPTTEEARQILGDAPYGGLAANLMGTISVMKRGTIATSFFDASQDWTTTLYAKFGDGGLFVPGTANDHIPNVRVKNSPSAAMPFLELDMQTA